MVWLKQGRDIKLAQIYPYKWDITSKKVIEVESEVFSLGKKSEQLPRVWLY